MADHVDCIKMMALGRSFAIGSLYNYVEDVAIPNARLWDPDDVSRLSVVSTERKENVKVHSMSSALQTTEEEDDSSWLSEMDEHSAMSLTAGLFRSPFTGAWQYISDRAGSSSRGTEIAIHCRCSTKKVSIDPKSQLEIICRPERIIKNKATHVVVAVKFGLEAFCVFQNPEVSTTNDDVEVSVSEKMFDYANFFAKGLSDGRKKLELDHDKEGDEEDGGHDLIPAEMQCIVYKDVLGVKKGHQSWTSNNVAEQYEACRVILDHQVKKAVPLKIWLYPLAKLMPTEAGIIKLPDNKIDVSRHLVIKCQMMWKQWQHIRMETDAIKTEISQRSTVQRCWIPLAVSKRINDFDKCLNEFMSAMQQALYEWTISIRRGGEPEEKMAEMVAAVERKSPFIPEELENWLIDHRKQLKTLKTLSQLPGVHLVTEFKQLEKEIKSLGNNVFAVVLHLPSISDQLDNTVQELRSYLDAINKSHPAHPSEWIREGKVDHRSAADRRQFISVAQEFSDWVTHHNSDNSNVHYLIFYNDQPICGAAELPFLRLYDSTFESNVNFTIPKAPGPVTVEKNYRGAITLSWTTEVEIEELNYLLQYRNIDGSGERWDSIQHKSKEITISHLQSEESYVFRVAAVTPGGRSPFSPVSCEVTIDPVCPPPAGLQCQYVTDNSITISWDHVEIEEEDEEADTSDDEDYYEDVNSSSDFDDGSICNRMLESKDSVQHVKEIKNKKSVVSCYLIDCWMAGNQDSSFIQRSTTETIITLEPLDLGTTYCIQVRAVCNDGAGSSFYSPATPILEAETLEEAERAAHIVRRVSKKCPVGSDIDAYRLPLKKRHGTKTQGVGHYVFGEPSYLALAGKRRQRTILMLGATGSGKSTLINAMVNYVLGVEWDDDFRFKLIDEPADKSQAHSQTDLVTTYDLYEMKGSRLNYSLTVVDTPGFGDTRGLEKDKKIMQQIQDYFQCRHGIQQLEAVCFVVQSSLPRLTATQKYIFDSILSIFGQDIKDNIRLMVTFSDGALPPVLGAVKEAGIPSPMDPSTGLPLHHKFNNSIFFTSNKGDRQTNEFNRTYFDMAVGGFDKFFDDLGVMESKSLTLTREVLEERKRLEALVEGLQMKTEMKLTRVDELEKIKKILKENEDQMDANQAFEFETLVPKSTDISGTGQFTTNCQNCRTTCHFPCRQAHDNDKHRCSVMDRSGNCMICKCPWNVHFNQKYRYEMVKEKVQRSSDAIRQQYQGAVSAALTNEQLLARIEKEIKKHESQLMELMKATYPCIQRLDEIALRPHPFSTPDYIDLMIAAEKQEHRPGYQQRIVTLRKLREMADITAKLIRDGQPVVSIPSREDHIQSKNSKSSLSLLKSKIVCEKQNFPKVNMAEVKCGKGFSAYNCKRCKKTCEKPAKIIYFEKKMCKDRHCNCPPSAHVFQPFSLLKIKEKVTTPLLDMKAKYESVGKCPVNPAQQVKVNAGSCGRGRGFLLAMGSTGSPGELTHSGRGETSSRSAQNYSGSSKIPSTGPGAASAVDPRYQSRMSGTYSHVAASTTSFSSQRKTEVTKDGGGAGRGRGGASKWQENSVTPAQQEKGNLGSCCRGRGISLNLLAMGSTGSPGESTHSGRGETSSRSAQNYSGASASGSGTDPRCQSKMSGSNIRVSDPASTSSSSTQRKREETKAGGETGHGLGRGHGIAPKWQFPHSSHFKDGRRIGYFSGEPENYYKLSEKTPKSCQKKVGNGQKLDDVSSTVQSTTLLNLDGESNQACEPEVIETYSLTGNANEPLSSEEETEQRAQQPKKAESLFWKFLNFFSRSPK